MRELQGSEPDRVMNAKQLLRTEIRNRRRATSEQDRELARVAVSAIVLRWCAAHLEAGATVAAYVPLTSEPLSPVLLHRLHEGGFRVIVPRTLADNDLDWCDWASGGEVTLGKAAISGARFVLVPAFAVDTSGRRLGRGGGSYDRALQRIAPGTTTAAVVFEGELLSTVPVHPWDVAVTAIIRPSGLLAVL